MFITTNSFQLRYKCVHCAASLGNHLSMLLASLLASSPQQTRKWTWSGRWTRCSWPSTPGRPWWPPPLRWWRRDIGEIWIARISPPGAQRPLLKDGQLPPPGLLLALLLHRLLHLGQALLGSVWLGRHLLEVYWQGSDAGVVVTMVQALLCNSSSCTYMNSICCTRCTEFLFSQSIFHIVDLLSCKSQPCQVPQLFW